MLNPERVLAIPGPTEPWHTGTLVGFDLETTGRNPHTARIVTASIVLLDPEGNLRANVEWLVDPEVEIPAVAAAVHRVTPQHARAQGMAAILGGSGIDATL